MNKQELIERIIDLEWPMFHSVNGEDRADCQENPMVFRAMRKAQYDVWDEASLESYLKDVEQAQKQGRNLPREKYIRMMATTDPAGYEAFRGELPPVSGEQERLSEAIWARMLVQTEKMREKYPVLALGGRPLRAEEEQGYTSIESYQKAELLTYSEQTLERYLQNLLALEARGIDLVYQIQENSITCMGYTSMEQAEAVLARQVLEAMGATRGCSGGSCALT